MANESPVAVVLSTEYSVDEGMQSSTRVLQMLILRSSAVPDSGAHYYGVSNKGEWAML